MVLLDTHVWLWALLEPNRLPAGVRAQIEAPKVRVHLSAISVWEAMVLARKGRLQLRGEADAWVREALRRSAATMLPITHAIAIRSETLLGFAGTDPADRFLAATALEHDLTLATADTQLIDYEPVSTIAWE